MVPLPDDHNLPHFVTDYTYETVSLPDTTPSQTSDSDGTMFSDSGSSYHTMSTLQSNEVADYFRSVYGFTFPSDENVPLLFPTDATADRLDVLLHIIVRLCRGGSNVPAGVDEMLRKGGVDGEGRGARVLDMVTNSGTWVNEMAGIYSTARYTSLDTKPLAPHKPHARIDFQVYNFYAGIMEPDASFDLVHLRQGVLATKNFNFLLEELHRVLKPNGHIIITELPVKAYQGTRLYLRTSTNPRVPIDPTTHVARGVQLMDESCAAEGVDFTAWQDMSARLDPSHPLWGNQHGGASLSFDPYKVDNIQGVRGFHSINSQEEPAPFGTWHTEESQKILGGLMRLWCFHISQSALPMVLLRGLEEDEAKKYIDGLLQEVMDMDRHQAYLICHMWSARRI